VSSIERFHCTLDTLGTHFKGLRNKAPLDTLTFQPFPGSLQLTSTQAVKASGLPWLPSLHAVYACIQTCSNFPQPLVRKLSGIARKLGVRMMQWCGRGSCYGGKLNGDIAEQLLSKERKLQWDALTFEGLCQSHKQKLEPLTPLAMWLLNTVAIFVWCTFHPHWTVCSSGRGGFNACLDSYVRYASV